MGTRRARKGEQPEGAASLVLPQRAGVRSKGAILSRERMAPLNPQEKSQGIKQLMAGGGVVLIGTTLIPLLSGLFG